MYSTTQNAWLVPNPCSAFIRARASAAGSFQPRTRAAHSSRVRPDFAGSSAVHFCTIATDGWTS
ncbi:MAG: hypothetical protein U0804_06455 [Gemmataceae bacterium]